MDGLRLTYANPQVISLGEELFALEIDLTLYHLSAMLRACYKFTGRCYLFLARTEHPDWITVSFLTRGTQGTENLLGDFCNELLDQQVRMGLETEMRPIREMIVAQAFAEGNLLDPLRDEGNYENDPLGIGDRR